jgi:hypothetical protein
VEMKFCQIISAFYRNDTRIFFKQSLALKELGFEVYLIANDGKPSETRDGVKIVSSGLSVGSRLRRILFSGKRIFEIAVSIDADIYMIHDPEMIHVGLALLKRGKKVLYDAHENFPKQLLEKEWLPRPLRWLLSWLSEAYFHITLPRFSYLTTVTPDLGKVSSTFCFQATPVSKPCLNSCICTTWLEKGKYEYRTENPL